MTFYKELGKKLRQHHEAIDEKVEKIDKHVRYVNTELDHCHLTFDESVAGKSLAVNTILPFTKAIDTNMDVNTDTYSISLKAGKTYQILSDFYSGVKDFMAYFDIVDKTNDVKITRFCKATANYNGVCTPTIGNVIYKPETDCEICVQVNQVSGTLAIASDPVNLSCSFLTVKEINRQIVIDPLEYVNESQGIEDSPVGHIIAHMGTVAPKHYLICDGTEYNIADYPYLAQHIEDNFDSINFFGGDGETTFAVPDLRGEFLRGTGTGTRDSGSGATVGQHQEPTSLPAEYQYIKNIGSATKTQITYRMDDGNIASDGNYSVRNSDNRVKLKGNVRAISVDGVEGNTTMTFAAYTTRPTNTAVLYCIKYEPTYFMNTYNTNYMQPSMYSLEEKVVGCWIDGRPLYEKTIKITTPSDSNGVSYSTGLENINNAYVVGGFVLGTNGYTHPINMSVPVSNGTQMSFCDIKTDGTAVYFRTNTTTLYNVEAFIVVQYTKTTDEENSFTNDMLKNSYIELTYSNEEIADMVADILGGEE